MTRFSCQFDAVDTLMFRDGRPFNQNDAGASEADSVFPPHPPTLVGAIRAMLWHTLGGRPEDWDKTKLGDGTNWQHSGTLGPLRFGPPLLSCATGPVFPVPLHLVHGTSGHNQEKQMTFLKPDGQYDCDLGAEIQFPAPQNTFLQGIKSISDSWVTQKGMQSILDGYPPGEDQVIDQKDLWMQEPRVGVGIDWKSRTTSDGQLYMASHIRLRDDVSLRMSLTGWGDTPPDARLHPVAGEHRMAKISVSDTDDLPKVDTGDARFCIIAISPVVPDRSARIEGIESSQLASACLGKAIPIGGWDSAARQSVPLRNFYPAGSVWFMESGAAIPQEIGGACEWGFGQVLIGKW